MAKNRDFRVTIERKSSIALTDSLSLSLRNDADAKVFKKELTNAFKLAQKD